MPTLSPPVNYSWAIEMREMRERDEREKRKREGAGRGHRCIPRMERGNTSKC